MDAIYRYRDRLASGPALLMLGFLLTMVARPAPPPAPPDTIPIEMSMIAPPAEPSPPPPQPPRPVEPPPKPTPAIARPLPVAISPSPASPAEIALPHVPTEAAPEAARPAQPTHTPPRTNPVVELEASYVAKVRQILNAMKRYPTGREASLLRPTGMARVWLVLDRDGHLIERGIDTSSQSLLLDSAALKTVGLASYPPFPQELWPGQTQHRFYADIDFIIPNS